MITIRDLMTDPALFGEQFGGESWAAWRALLCGFYGLELSEDELTHWQALTGRQSAPEAAHDELWLAIGRRGGKSNMAALLAVFEACFRDHRDRLAPGEVAFFEITPRASGYGRSRIDDAEFRIWDKAMGDRSK